MINSVIAAMVDLRKYLQFDCFLLSSEVWKLFYLGNNYMLDKK